jgi:dTDP-4-amino-4,6-dideoxygalactose transaminase
MHTFGLPGRIQEIAALSEKWGIPLVEDAAESVGSYVGGRHTGTFGKVGAFSFNGNKPVTCGGGGCIVTDDERLGVLGKHLTTTAKVPHAYEYVHDQVGYNYRLPNLNAALACAQLEQLAGIQANKRATTESYSRFCESHGIAFARELPGTTSNYWLNAVIVESREQRDALLEASKRTGIMTRPVWRLMHYLPAFADAQRGLLPNAEALEARVVNIPSSVRPQ